MHLPARSGGLFLMFGRLAPEVDSMALRVLLVGLVAGMGCELPGGDDLAAWNRAGRAWVEARMADLAAIRCELGAAPAALAEAEPVEPAAIPTSDLAFEVVVEGMVSGFAADLAGSPEPDAAIVLAPEPEPIPTVEPTSLAWVDPEPAPAPFIEEPAPTPAPGRAHQFASAVRLTGEALSAWASLIEGLPGSVAAVR